MSVHATTYLGNGHTGFGGPVGNGSLTLTGDGTTLFGTVTKGTNGFNDALVIYIDSTAGDFLHGAGTGNAGTGWLELRATLRLRRRA